MVYTSISNFDELMMIHVDSCCMLVLLLKVINLILTQMPQISQAGVPVHNTIKHTNTNIFCQVMLNNLIH